MRTPRATSLIRLTSLVAVLGMAAITLCCTNFTATDGQPDAPFMIAPTIGTQPASVTVTKGSAATLSVVTATGTPLNYQWFKGGTAVSGATTSSYAVTSAQSTDEGSYTVTVSNPISSVTSTAATITVNSLPEITTQPRSVIVNSGSPATFTVVATGKPTPTYQWKKNGTNITGATSASYTNTAAAVGDTGAVYTVNVVNSVGTVTSQEAVLSVVDITYAVKPTITAQPSDAFVLPGATATFTVVATGTPAPTYKWYLGTTLITGATSASYTTAATVTGDTGKLYKVDVTNTAGYVTSRQAKLTVGNPVALVNDSFISHPGAGVGGAGVSVVQTALGLTTQGNGGTATLGNGFSAADDFTVSDATGWQVDEAVFSLYLTGGSITTPPAFTCNIQIWNGPPNVTGSAVIWGDTTTNRTTTVTWIGYRTNDTTIATDGTRSLYNISCKGLGIALPQGTYWVEYRGGHTSGVYMVPRVVIGSAATGNAIRILSSAWTAWVDGGTAKAPQGLPFQVKGWVK